MDPLMVLLAVAVLLVAVVVISLAQGVISFRAGNKANANNVKDGMSRTQAKHQILLNPVFHAYFWTILAVVLFSYIFYMYFYAN